MFEFDLKAKKSLVLRLVFLFVKVYKVCIGYARILCLSKVKDEGIRVFRMKQVFGKFLRVWNQIWVDG